MATEGRTVKGAGTAEGYDDPDSPQLYRCERHDVERTNHRAWVWWCPWPAGCDTVVVGSQASARPVSPGTLAYPPLRQRPAVARISNR